MWKKPQPEDLERSRDARIARVQLERQDEYVALLRRAAALRAEAGQSNDVIDYLIESAQTEQRKLFERAGGRIFPRKRPVRRQPSEEDACLIFLDECGSHSLNPRDGFPVFCLLGVVVRESAWPELNEQWRKWKHEKLGDAEAVIHEPEIRRGDWPFGGPGRAELLGSMNAAIDGFDFTAVAVTIRRAEYAALVGTSPLDESLPSHMFLMSLDFLCERVVMALDSRFNGGRGRVVAESRGPKEDATLQHEFARLHLQGTSYISSAWFRQQLHPGITFESKGGKHATGLQLADLAARPCAEKVAMPDSTPTKNSILGLKILPWAEEYAGVWKSEAAASLTS